MSDALTDIADDIDEDFERYINQIEFQKKRDHDNRNIKFIIAIKTPNENTYVKVVMK